MKNIKDITAMEYMLRESLVSAAITITCTLCNFCQPVSLVVIDDI